MNELIGEEDMMMLDSVPDEKTMLAMARERVKGCGKPIKMTAIR